MHRHERIACDTAPVELNLQQFSLWNAFTITPQKKCPKKTQKVLNSAKIEPKGSQKGPILRPPDPQGVAKRAPRDQKGAKREPKGPQGAKREPKGSQKGPMPRARKG